MKEATKMMRKQRRLRRKERRIEKHQNSRFVTMLRSRSESRSRRVREDFLEEAIQIGEHRRQRESDGL